MKTSSFSLQNISETTLEPFHENYTVNDRRCSNIPQHYSNHNLFIDLFHKIIQFSSFNNSLLASLEMDLCIFLLSYCRQAQMQYGSSLLASQNDEHRSSNIITSIHRRFRYEGYEQNPEEY